MGHRSRDCIPSQTMVPVPNILKYVDPHANQVLQSSSKKCGPLQIKWTPTGSNTWTQSDFFKVLGLSGPNTSAVLSYLEFC